MFHESGVGKERKGDTLGFETNYFFRFKKLLLSTSFIKLQSITDCEQKMKNKKKKTDVQLLLRSELEQPPSVDKTVLKTFSSLLSSASAHSAKHCHDDLRWRVINNLMSIDEKGKLSQVNENFFLQSYNWRQCHLWTVTWVKRWDEQNNRLSLWLQLD